MDVLALSDIHGNWRALKEVLGKEPCDLVLIAGDLSDYSGSADKVIEVISNFVEDSNAEAFAVLGNMDSPQLLKNLPDVKGFKALHGDVITYSNYLVVGFSGGLRSPFHTSFELGENDFRALVNSVLKNLGRVNPPQPLILLTHTPPYNTKVDLTYSGLHVGSEVLRDFIESNKPRLTVCGHIHEGRGTDVVGDSLVLNPGPLFKGYYATVKLGEAINYELKSLK